MKSGPALTAHVLTAPLDPTKWQTRRRSGRQDPRIWDHCEADAGGRFGTEPGSLRGRVGVESWPNWPGGDLAEVNLGVAKVPRSWPKSRQSMLCPKSPQNWPGSNKIGRTRPEIGQPRPTRVEIAPEMHCSKSRQNWPHPCNSGRCRIRRGQVHPKLAEIPQEMASTWGRCGVDLGSVQGRSGASGRLWGRSGVGVGSAPMWGQARASSESFWGRADPRPSNCLHLVPAVHVQQIERRPWVPHAIRRQRLASAHSEGAAAGVSAGAPSAELGYLLGPTPKGLPLQEARLHQVAARHAGGRMIDFGLPQDTEMLVELRARRPHLTTKLGR